MAALAGVQLVFSFFGVDVFSKIVDAIKSIGQESRDTAEGLENLSKSILDATSAVTNSSFSALRDDLEKFSIDQIIKKAQEVERAAIAGAGSEEDSAVIANLNQQEVQFNVF